MAGPFRGGHVHKRGRGQPPVHKWNKVFLKEENIAECSKHENMYFVLFFFSQKSTIDSINIHIE